MSHSFGEGYATRSDEEGFGGIYSGNQSLQQHKSVHENHPGYNYKLKLIICFFFSVFIGIEMENNY